MTKELEKKKRRPYEAPRVSGTRQFETLALSCGKQTDDGSGPLGEEGCRGGSIQNS